MTQQSENFNAHPSICYANAADCVWQRWHPTQPQCTSHLCCFCGTAARATCYSLSSPEIVLIPVKLAIAAEKFSLDHSDLSSGCAWLKQIPHLLPSRSRCLQKFGFCLFGPRNLVIANVSLHSACPPYFGKHLCCVACSAD